MNYETLKKIFYLQPDAHKKIYSDRVNSPFTKHFDFEIREFNHNVCYSAFFCHEQNITLLIEKVYRNFAKFIQIVSSVPPVVLHQFALSCVVDEVHSTSNIEGVHSTHKEIKDILLWCSSDLTHL